MKFCIQWRMCSWVRKPKADGKEVLVGCYIGQLCFHTFIFQFVFLPLVSGIS